MAVVSKKIYVSGIRDVHSEEELKQYFGAYGPIERVEVVVDKVTGKKRGFAFVNFHDFDAVDKVVCKLNIRNFESFNRKAHSIFPPKAS